MTSKRATLRRKRAERRVQIKIEEYISWCKDHVTIRDENGVEHPVSTSESIEFILMTMSSAKPQTESVGI